jgi:hypothetical protein
MNLLHIHALRTPYFTCVYWNISELFISNVPVRNVPSHPFLVEWIHNKFPSYSLIDAYLVTNSSILRDTKAVSRSVIVLFVPYFQVQDPHRNSFCSPKP